MKLLVDIQNFKNLEEGIYCYAFGGVPFIELDNVIYFNSKPVDLNILKDMICNAVGASGMLTHANKSNLSYNDMGKLCISKGHRWAYHWINLSFLFIGKSKNVELAFLRDKNFYESWNINDSDNYHVNYFAFNGSLYAFRKFTDNLDDNSFSKEIRRVMDELHTNFGSLWI
jgi:hypothetical protein